MTAAAALWFSLPVLTCIRTNRAERVAARLLLANGISAQITHSIRAYEAKAIELALDPNRLNEI